MPPKKPNPAETIGAEFIAGMEQLLTTAKAGGLKGVKKTHGLPIPKDASFDLPTMKAKDVKAARTTLGVSQAVFARILGSSVQAVRAWEQGAKPPSGVARRLLAEIRHDPAYWRKRFGLADSVAG